MQRYLDEQKQEYSEIVMTVTSSIIEGKFLLLNV